jgi:hypothetical protein
MSLTVGSCALIAIAAFAPSWVHAQEAPAPPIVVTGKVLSIKVESNETYRLRYQAGIELCYRNVSDRPVIFARRDPLWIEDADVDWKDDGSAVFLTSQTSDPVIYQAIDQQAPPASETVTLPPKGEYRIRTKVALHLPRNEQNVEHMRSKTLPASIELTLTTWPRIYANSKSPAVEDLGPDELIAFLKARWATYGDLAPAEIEAQPIQFDLPIPAKTPQASGLVLRGKVTGWEAPPEKSKSIEFNAKLQLELKNTGKKAILVLKPECTGYGDYVLGSVLLLSAPDAKDAGNVLTDFTAWYSRDKSDKWKVLRDEMDHAASPEQHFWLIPPGASRVFQSSVFLRFDRTRRTDIFPPQEPWPEIEKHKQLWLAVSIQIWPGNLEPKYDGIDNPEFGRKLRSRWAKTGLLDLGEDGILNSEPFPIVLPIAP